MGSRAAASAVDRPACSASKTHPHAPDGVDESSVRAPALYDGRHRSMEWPRVLHDGVSGTREVNDNAFPHELGPVGVADVVR
jgi:hypothetical protein